MHLCQSQHSAECGVVVLGSLPKKKEYKPLSIPLVCLLGLRFCRMSLNCIMPMGVRQKALRALRIAFTKSS